MRRLTLSRIVLFFAILLLGFAVLFVKRSLGQTVANHVAGGMLLCVAVALTLRPSLSFYSGFRKVGVLTEWKTALVVVPVCALAIAILSS